MAAYLLGMGPMPLPTQQEMAIATANYILDNPTPGPANVHNNSEENIDPQLLNLQLSQVNHPQSKPHNIIWWWCIDFPWLSSWMCANMDLDPTTTQIGWKTIDDAQHMSTQQLASKDDLKNAFRDLLSWRTILKGRRLLCSSSTL